MKNLLMIFCFLCTTGILVSQEKMTLEDIFELEYISDPQISPDGQSILYVRNSMDIYSDGMMSQIWMTNIDGSNNRPITEGNARNSSPRWSPDGKKVLFLSNRDKGNQIYVRWMDSGTVRRLSHLQESPSNISWSPDGTHIAFNMRIEKKTPPFVTLLKAPKGAEWATPPKYIEKINYKSDGAGFLRDAYNQIFVMSVDGGYARQLTEGDEDYSGPFSWSKDSKHLYFSTNIHEDKDFDPRNSELYQLEIATGDLKPLTDRKGPDSNPLVSPDGKKIAYTGNDENLMGYQITSLYVMDVDGSNSKLISKDFDRDVTQIKWSADGKSILFLYDTEGQTFLAQMDMGGKVSNLTGNVGGLSLGRPYAGGSYSVASNGNVAYTLVGTDHPADLGFYDARSGKTQRLTQVNADLFSHKVPGEVEEIWYTSSYDGQKVQGWICKPPGFDPSKKYPLILEIHGGPFLNYGSRYAAEIQLFASAGYVVLYTNPRGSTSYGAAFANEIHHNYPSQDYDDLISGVDAVIEKGYIDTDNLFVTGGSGGGVLTAWIVGKTDRFRAAVVAKPVINWSSFVLHADGPATFAKYWFGKYPWEDINAYWDRSPLSLVANVTTPTMLLTGEQDYRTPMSETEQYYAALKLNKVETAMVRIQDAGHGIANRPSNLANKVAYVLAWFEKYRTNKEE